MSWDYHVAGDAWPSIRELDPPVQEALLDEIEVLADDADNRLEHGELIERVMFTVDGEFHVITLLLIFNADRRLLSVLGVLD